MAFTPRVYRKGNRTEVANSYAEETSLRWDGWLPDDGEPHTPPPPFSATELEALRAAFVRRQVDGVPVPKVADIVTSFQAGHGFTVLGGVGEASLFTDDTAEFVIGTQSLAVGTIGDASATSVQRTAMTPTLDATDKALTLTFRIEDAANVTELIVYAASGGGFTNYYQWTLSLGRLTSDDWQTITLPFGGAAVVGAPDRAALDTYRIRAMTATGTTTVLHYNRIGTVPDPVADAIVSICVDDLYASMWSTLRPILDDHGFPATVYAIPERAIEEIVSVERLHLLEDVSGWEVAGHGLTNLTSMTLAAAEADLIASRRWLQDNGFRGVDHYAYPGGGFNPEIEAVMRRLYRSGRTIASGHETSPPANAYRLRSTSVSNATPVASVTAAITAAAQRGGHYILTLHDITADALLGTQYKTADVETICAHIASLGLPVRTVGDVLAGA